MSSKGNYVRVRNANGVGVINITNGNIVIEPIYKYLEATGISGVYIVTDGKQFQLVRVTDRCLRSSSICGKFLFISTLPISEFIKILIQKPERELINISKADNNLNEYVEVTGDILRQILCRWEFYSILKLLLR